MATVEGPRSNWQTFATRLERVSWMRLRRHVEQMPGGALVDVACDRMNEAALIFTYAGCRFGIELGEGVFRFSTEGSDCPPAAQAEVLDYADRLLAPKDRE